MNLVLAEAGRNIKNAVGENNYKLYRLKQGTYKCDKQKSAATVA